MILTETEKELLKGILDPIVDMIADRVVEKLEPVIREPKKVEQKLYGREEVCKLLHISLPTLKKYTDNGTLKAVRMGDRRVLYDAEEIERLIAGRVSFKYKR